MLSPIKSKIHQTLQKFDRQIFRNILRDKSLCIKEQTFGLNQYFMRLKGLVSSIFLLKDNQLQKRKKQLNQSKKFSNINLRLFQINSLNKKYQKNCQASIKSYNFMQIRLDQNKHIQEIVWFIIRNFGTKKVKMQKDNRSLNQQIYCYLINFRYQNQCQCIYEFENFLLKFQSIFYFINQSYKSLKQMISLTTLFKLCHSILIIYITFLLYEINKTIPVELIGLEILLTLFVGLLERKTSGFSWNQLFLSISLVYALRPTQLNALRYLFLAKIFYVQRSLAETSQNIFVGSFKLFRLLKVVFDFARLTFVFYMVLGIFIVAYKYWAYLWTDPQKTLSTHQILYFFMITSSSIGYGDVTPKNQYQMYFLITFIPILIISFGQYFGQAVGYFDQFIGILKQSSYAVGKAQLLNESVWNSQECTNLTDYINHAQARNSSIHEEKQNLAHNWISLAYKNFQSHQPLLMELLDSQDSTQYKLLVASKLKRQFFPKNWTIVQKGNIDKHIFMIEQGQVQANGQVLGAGKTFNLNGFMKQQPSAQTYITRSFTSVWAISVADLLQIGRSSINLQTKINNKLKVAQGQL